MNPLELLLFAYAVHIVLSSVMFYIAGSHRLSDDDLTRLSVAVLWPVTMPMLAGLWLWTRLRAVRLPRATLRVKGKR